MPYAEVSSGHLYLTRNEISDLTPLKDLPLENLFLNNNRIADLEPLRNMNTLQYPTLTGNLMLTDVSPLGLGA